MAKLAARDRKKVESAEAVSGVFEPLRPGKYVATLNEVEAKQSKAGNPIWNAEFTEITTLDGDKKPGRQWYNLNLPTSDKAPESYAKTQETWEKYQGMCAGRLKAFFEAFGYSTDSDTDEMIGDRVILQIGVRTIQSGDKAGQRTNEVNGVFALDSVKISASASSDSGGGSEDDF